MKRREFIQTSAFATAGLLSFPSFMNAARVKGALGLQLYTLRDSIEKDPRGVIQKVAAFGYKELETYSYSDGKIYGMPFSEFGKLVKSLGMKVTSGHYDLALATSNSWGKAVAEAKSIGQKYMVVPSLDNVKRKSIDDYKKICGQLNKAGEVCNKQGMRFGYHNHAFEFDILEGQVPYDVMLAELDPKYVGMEMDIYWLVRAGHDPIQYFDKYPGRFEQWHVKDMDRSDPDRNADVGTGSIDYKPIFAKAKKSGMKHWYVEQESYPGDPMESVGACAKFLKTLL